MLAYSAFTDDHNDLELKFDVLSTQDKPHYENITIIFWDIVVGRARMPPKRWCRTARKSPTAPELL